MNKRWGFREIVVYLHVALQCLVAYQDLVKRVKRRREIVFCLRISHVGLNAHAQKKGCIRNRLKFAMAAALWQYSFAALF